MNITTLTGYDIPSLLLIAAVIFFAGFMRGYAGFGLSALAVSALSIVIDVSAIVPVVWALEVAASVQMVPTVVHQIDRPLLSRLTIGMLVAVPFGQWLLLSLNADTTRIVVSSIVLLLVGFNIFGLSLERFRSKGFYLITGIIGGTINGMVAMGGLVVSSILLNTTLSINTLRATLIAFFFFTGIYAIIIGYVSGLVNGHTLIVSALMLPPMIFGVRAGHRRFNPARVKTYRRATLGLLAVLAVSGLMFTLYR
ncbi:MAG: hypothetical protein DHS20C01_03250 [marine bacterium B5-7]|nr:MAG: hypothetical protein DHS20C01_03250 [marine bacterium B5-7]